MDETRRLFWAGGEQSRREVTVSPSPTSSLLTTGTAHQSIGRAEKGVQAENKTCLLWASLCPIPSHACSASGSASPEHWQRTLPEGDLQAKNAPSLGASRMFHLGGPWLSQARPLLPLFYIQRQFCTDAPPGVLGGLQVQIQVKVLKAFVLFVRCMHQPYHSSAFGLVWIVQMQKNCCLCEAGEKISEFSC